MTGSIRIVADDRSDALVLMRSLAAWRPYLVQLTARRWEVRALADAASRDDVIRLVETWAAVRRLDGATVTLDDGTSRRVGPRAGSAA
jgi:hypothetical protein